MTPEPLHLEVSRLIHADRDTVFSAWTDPTKIVQWWGAGGVVCTEAELDLVVGGTYRFANRKPDGTTMWITGTFERVEPPHELEYTWAVEPIDPDAEPSRVHVTFGDVGDDTLVTIVHTGISSPEARETNLIGWTGCLEGLQRLLVS